ncbi:hypothetical protein ACFQ41_11010 [Lacticaseibacillus suilingensis]|uniref:Uncharacterized protein n=1 Tax=Lacticaseibacillus suilingensis TaxID=2799577 RepID=A0ABW4BIV1_9LACO|nr:hypothetical protein [Lacticaseibacillus suilingensis]
MADKPEIVQIKIDKTLHSQIQAPTKALQIKIDCRAARYSGAQYSK